MLSVLHEHFVGAPCSKHTYLYGSKHDAESPALRAQVAKLIVSLAHKYDDAKRRSYDILYECVKASQELRQQADLRELALRTLARFVD